MRLRRRRLLALFPILLAGCGEASERTSTRTSEPTSGSARPASTPTPTGPRVRRQSIAVGNTRPEPQFVTVAVEFEGETVFVESRELVPSERHTMRTPIDRAGTYDVVVETAGGDRTTYAWQVDDGLDGLAVTLTAGIDLIRTVRCDLGCPAVLGGDRLDEPLVGDGSPRWYAPAEVVLRNPGTAVEAVLSVSLDGESLVDARYRVARESRVVVPLTYRSGTYQVAVDVNGERVVSEWRVPEEPTRVVDLTSLAVGCGPTNSELRVENYDDDTHTVDVSVERDGDVRFTEQFRLGPDERRAVVPVRDSGRYEVRWQVDGGVEGTETWWSCPPHGTATLLVDATGTAALSQEDSGL